MNRSENAKKNWAWYLSTIFVISQKLWVVIIWSLRCGFQKCTFFGLALFPALNLTPPRICHIFISYRFGIGFNIKDLQNRLGEANKCLWMTKVNAVVKNKSKFTWHHLSSPRKARAPAGFSRIKKIPYQAPPTQLGPQKCTFCKDAFLGPKYQCQNFFLTLDPPYGAFF